MIGHFLDFIITLLLFHYLPALVVQHSLLRYSPQSIIVFVSLLLLRNCMTVFVLSCAVLEVALVFYFAVGTHSRGTDVSLADIRAFLACVVQSFVGPRKVQHVFKGVSKCSAEATKAHIPERSHNLIHLTKGVILPAAVELMMRVFPFASASAHEIIIAWS